MRVLRNILGSMMLMGMLAGCVVYGHGGHGYGYSYGYSGGYGGGYDNNWHSHGNGW